MILWRIIFLPILLPASVLYALIMLFRNFLYDLKILRVQTAKGVKIISVGNLTAGGTGKTPLTAFLIEEFLKRNRSVGLISRGYGGTYSSEKSVSRVDAKVIKASEKFGDEPTWFAQKFSNLPVYVAHNKIEAAHALLIDQAAEVIFADDAFQHRRLSRDLDIVIIDASASFFEYLPLPLGRGREDFYLGLQRADLIILNKINLASPRQILRIRKILNLLKPHRAAVVEMKTELSGFYNLQSGAPISVAQLTGSKVVVACAIAKPTQFLRMIDKHMQVCGQLFLRDHAKLNSDFVQKVDQLVETTGAQYIVVTEKDAVKLSEMKFNSPVLVSQLKISSEELVDAIFARLHW